MARYLNATWKPIATRSTTPLRADLLCLHTIVGGGVGCWSYFNSGAGGRGVYSHFIIQGKWSNADTDGVTWQCQDTAYIAKANYNGNGRIISVETADNAARPIAPWTPAQETAIVNLMVWAHRTHGIPLSLVPDSKPGRRGIAYHEQGCNPVRVDGGELWSSAYGKDCPTNARISRIPALIARARAIVNPTPAPTPAPTEKRYFVDAGDRAAFLEIVNDAIETKFPAAGGCTDRIAQRSRQIMADGRLPYGLDTLRSLIVSGNAGLGELMQQQGLDTAAIKAEIDQVEQLVKETHMAPTPGA